MPDDLHALIDRDAYIKLPCCDLLDTTLTSLGITHPFRLPSATSIGAKTPIRRYGFPPELASKALGTIDAASRRIPQIPVIWMEEAQTNQLFNAMILKPGIDPGEAALSIIALYSPKKCLFLTGDKRFIQSLRQHFPHEYEKLRSRIYSFEACILSLCDDIGFNAIHQQCYEGRQCDGALKIALSQGMYTTETHFREALISFGQ